MILFFTLTVLLNLCLISISYASPLEKTSAEEQRAQRNTVSSSLSIKAPENTILVMGDSISAGFGIDKSKGWVELIKERLSREYTDQAFNIINASISGETTTGGRYRLAAALKQHQPDLVILELGGNDGLRGTPIKHIQANLDVMTQQAKASGAQVIILGMRIPPNYGERYTGQFTGLYEALAQKNETLLVPFFMDGLAGVTGMIQADGIHPTLKGQPLMMQNVWQVLKTWPVLVK